MSDTDTSIKLQDKPWKIWMNTSPRPTTVISNLYDLIFYDDENNQSSFNLRVNKSYVKGLSLKHDILIYSADDYEINSGLPYRTLLSKDYLSRDLDLAIAYPSLLSKSRKLEDVKIGQNTYTFCLPDKDALISLKSAEEVYLSKYFKYDKDTGSSQLTPLRSPLENILGEEVSKCYKVLPYSPIAISAADIIVSEPDNIFEATTILKSGQKPYTQVAINLINSENILNLINKSLQNMVLDRTFVGFTTIESFKNWYNSLAVNAKDILQHCYIWVKAAFSADYIDPKDYNQDLNQESNVIHKNIYSHNKGDFERYDEPDGYIPKNAPLKDYITPEFTSQYTGSNDEKIKALMEDADKSETSNIGGLLSLPRSEKCQDLVPPQFFDKEKSYNTVASSFNDVRIPSILPKNGNLYTDGRIISPTIDEIWYMIKKLISGRNDDNVEFNDDFFKVEGLTTKLHKNEKDTRIKEVLNSNQFKFNIDNTTTKIGDPINISVDKDKITINEYVTQPDIITYKDYEEITKESNAYKSNNISEEDKKPLSISDITLEGIDTKTGSPVSIEDGKFAPRSLPLSLRELEAFALANKFNIEKIYKDLIYHTAKVGNLGKVKDQAAGSLYFLHKEFLNDKAGSPNTYYDKDSENTKQTAVYGDFAALATDQLNKELTAKEYGKTEVRVSPKKPLLKENYGKDINLNNSFSDSANASEVYLSASGEWRIRDEHTRFPILRSDY